MSETMIVLTIMKSGTSKKLEKRFNIDVDTLLSVKQAYCDQEDPTTEPSVWNLYKNKELRGDDKTLRQLKVTRSMTLTIIVKAYGGAMPKKNNKRVRNLNKSDPEIKISKKPDCIVFYDDSDGIERAEMPCGHAYCPQTMYDHVQRVFTKNNYEYEVFCGADKCKTKFDFDLCANVADMTDEEYSFFSNEIAKRSCPPTKACPHCNAECVRPESLTKFRIVCAKCRGPDWCFECGNKWHRGGFTVCGNNGCASMAINDLLSSCDAKATTYKDGNGNYIMVPKIRACPKCLSFIEHRDYCKHMTCKDCGNKFCFACLKPQVDNKWQCQSITYQCQIAPRQSF